MFQNESAEQAATSTEEQTFEIAPAVEAASGFRPIIHEKIKNLLPAPTAEEREQLKVSLKAGHCDTRLTVWKEEGILLDGHNRLELCDELNITPIYDLKSFPDREAAEEWIYSNQMGRRNLTRKWSHYLLGKRYLAEKKTHGGPREANGQNGHLTKRKETTDKIGVADRTLRRHAEFAKAVDLLSKNDPDKKKELLEGHRPEKEIMDEVKPKTTSGRSSKTSPKRSDEVKIQGKNTKATPSTTPNNPTGEEVSTPPALEPKGTDEVENDGDSTASPSSADDDVGEDAQDPKEPIVTHTAPVDAAEPTEVELDALAAAEVEELWTKHPRALIVRIVAILQEKLDENPTEGDEPTHDLVSES